MGHSRAFAIMSRNENGKGESNMVAQSPSAPASPVPVFPAAPLPIYFLGAAVSGLCLAGREDKKKADPKTSLKVFRRGCLKGRAFFAQIAFPGKCEEPKDDCMKRNQAWKSGVFPGATGVLPHGDDPATHAKTRFRAKWAVVFWHQPK
ncbi:hypothetical protein [Sphingobium fuliginis]|uniref:hypothetical protein n=1 Tax=Sphingobium fuliginis (strain ATCC 27551) TaxID=336203 RepID=UPI0011AF82C9|nr:hypothetical protein [Sphingobium fuliginis]